MKKVRIALMLVMIIIMSIMITGCGNATIEGDWVLVKEEFADGEVLNQSELEKEGISEKYHISGDKVGYTCMLFGQEINLELDLVDNGDGTYDFVIGDLSFVSAVKLKRNTFTYVTGEGDNEATFTFERQK